VYRRSEYDGDNALVKSYRLKAGQILTGTGGAGRNNQVGNFFIFICNIRLIFLHIVKFDSIALG
jgi:hypothetical protein